MDKEEIVIKAENISKLYRLGLVGSRTLSDDVKRWWAGLKGQEDPTLKIGESNKRDQKGGSDYVWALKDINFQVRKGEVLGIIGKNGAGKSTLLKLLSRVTEPTTGTIKLKGRIASLLEVGTGFHPELTGKENIFLNGAILGMNKAEIRSKIDEIIEFSGVDRYIDTPVKRYSSGMKVRLGFAVAAHLEPEILIVDEVLAVGDAEFQKKCLGKMKDVSGEGRTVLFVSHNMGSVKQLCDRAILLEDGKVTKEGGVEETITEYLSGSMSLKSFQRWDEKDAPGNENIKIKEVLIKPDNKNHGEPIFVHDDYSIEIGYKSLKKGHKTGLTLRFFSEQGVFLFVTGTKLEESVTDGAYYKSKVRIPGHFLNAGKYRVELMFGHAGKYVLGKFDDLISFEIHHSAEGRGGNLSKAPGLFRPNLKWVSTKV